MRASIARAGSEVVGPGDLLVLEFAVAPARQDDGVQAGEPAADDHDELIGALVQEHAPGGVDAALFLEHALVGLGPEVDRLPRVLEQVRLDVVDLREGLREAQRAGLKYYFIEDESVEAIDQIPQSLRYLEEIRF